MNAQDNTPLDYSSNLYVELISPQAKVISRHTLRLDNGLGHGDFKLADTLSGGGYRLRAYTNWMRNFGDNFIFEKDISIKALEKVAVSSGSSSERTAAGKNLIKKSAATATTDSLAVQFFPEGGVMVAGLSSLVAIKAEDSQGRGFHAKGDVLDNDNDPVASFACDSLGFGAFTLLPDVKQHYRVQVMINGQKHLLSLPQVMPGGFVMHSQIKQGHIYTAISCDAVTFNNLSGQTLFFTAKHSGKTWFKKALQLNNPEQLISLSKEILPEGIVCLTLTDQHTKPLCERLVYVHHYDNPELSIATDKKVYLPKEKITINIKLDKPLKANLSLAAVDIATVPVQPENIISYLNLRSEIRGKIENANRYFDTTNVNRFKQLDLLLLTQGWRGFVWKRIEDTTLKFERSVESGLTLTGKVTSINSNQSLSGMNVTMRATGAEGQKLFYANTDSAGRFTINNPVFYGYQLLKFNSRKSDALNDLGRTKGSKSGRIQVDSLVRDTLKVSSYNKDAIPVIYQSRQDL